jgi:SAM-dependent methyltransferase
LTYQRDNVRFEIASCTQFPCKDKSVDVVVSFETIEHISEHDQMFAEIRRVLKEDGLLVMSSPDKRHYSDARNYQNPFHVRELHEDEFLGLLRRHFKHVELSGQRIVHGSLIAPHDIPGERSFLYMRGDAHKLECRDRITEPLYLIGLASDIPPPTLPISSFDATSQLAKEVATAQGTAARPARVYPYRLGSLIDCRLGGNGPLYLTEGWSDAEAAGTWSTGGSAAIRFAPLPLEKRAQERFLHLTFRPFVVPAKHSCAFEIRLGEEVVFSGDFREKQRIRKSIPLPGQLPEAGKAMTLHFQFARCRSPADLGLSRDTRKLGISLEELAIG